MPCYFENSKELLTMIEYYGYRDFAGGIFAKNVVENLEILEKNVGAINSDVYDLVSLYQYIWISSFKKFVTEIDEYAIDDNIKDRIKQLSLKISPSNKTFVDYINKNYEIVFSKNSHVEVKWYEIADSLLELIYTKFSNVVSDNVFSFIERTMPLTLLSKFEICQKRYSKVEHFENFKSLFDGLEKTDIFDDRVYVDFLLRTKANYQYDFLKDKANFICKRELEGIKQKEINPNSEEIMQVASLLEEYSKLAKLFKLGCVADYSSYSLKVREGLDEYLHMHGQHFDSGPIDLSPAVDLLKKGDDPLRLLQITHNMVDGTFVNNCDSIFSVEKPDSLSEVFGELGNPRSDKYPYYKQQSMNLFLGLYTQIVTCVLCDEKLSNDFAKYLTIACASVEKNYFNGDVQISSEFFGAFEVLENIISFYRTKKGDAPITKALENGCCVNLCGTIEKILRNVLIKEVGNSLFIDPDSITLMQILNSANKLSDVSSGLRYYLEFYLSTECDFKGLKEERPGKNIRNIQMHNRNDKYENTKYNDALFLFFFAVSLLGDLLIKTLK